MIKSNLDIAKEIYSESLRVTHEICQTGIQINQELDSTIERLSVLFNNEEAYGDYEISSDIDVLIQKLQDAKVR